MHALAFTREALDDLLAARDWYRAISERLEQRFRADVNAAVRRVALAPMAWPPVGEHRRRCLLTHFPYPMVHRTDGEPIRVLALVHFRRKPAAWAGRR